MIEELRFTTDAGLIDRLGRELVGRQETALIELVKNSFDADADQVVVTLEPDALTVADTGTGMTRDEVISGFLRLASTLKVKEPRSRVFGRQRAGRKGIGRFSTQRLGRGLRLRTWVDARSPGLELTIDWEDFESGLRLDEIPVRLTEVPAATPGTVVRIEGLRDEWSDAQIRRCWRGLLALQQPFPVAPVKDRPKSDPGFTVSFFRESGLYDDPRLVADFQSEILVHHHAIVETRVDNQGVAEWRLSQNRFGPDRSWSKINHLHRDSPKLPPYVSLRNISMKAHYFILLTDLLPAFAFTRVREALREEGGIRLYRNGFRVVPYGEPGNDWLRLDQISASRGGVLAPFGNRNFFGVIEVYDPDGEQFEEHTSREGLIESDSFVELTGLTAAVLATAANRISEDRGRKPSAGGSTQRRAESALDRLKDVAKAVREAEHLSSPSSWDNPVLGKSGAREDESGSDHCDSSDAKLETPSALLQKSIDLLEQQRAELADEAALLRLLATLGLTTSEFSHETGMTFEAVRMDFRSVFEVALSARPGDEGFSAQVSRANAMLTRLDALTAYLNELASARSIRQLAPVSVGKAVEEFAVGVRRLAEKAGIFLEIDTPPYDPLFTKPMHIAEIASILLNLFSNSLKALRRVDGERRVHVKAERDGQD